MIITTFHAFLQADSLEVILEKQSYKQMPTGRHSWVLKRIYLQQIFTAYFQLYAFLSFFF